MYIIFFVRLNIKLLTVLTAQLFSSLSLLFGSFEFGLDWFESSFCVVDVIYWLVMVGKDVESVFEVVVVALEAVAVDFVVVDAVVVEAVEVEVVMVVRFCVVGEVDRG